MNSFQAYERIRAFKDCQSATLNGINYAHIVAPFLYDHSIIGFFKKLFFSLFFETKITHRAGKPENKILLYYSCRNKGRSDYDYIAEHLFDLLGRSCEYVETSEKFAWLQFRFVLGNLAEAWRQAKGYRVGNMQRLGCALLIAKYRSTAERLFPALMHGKTRLVTFCDAHAPENLMTQMAKVAGIESFTNQHGQYRILDAANMSSDAEAYGNFVSDYMLCWGEATRSEFVRAGFKSQQFIVAGWIKKWGRITSHLPRGVFGVMLNGESGRESNVALLEEAKAIAASLDLTYLVRLHPWSKAKQYSDYLDHRCAGIGHYDLPSYLYQVDFSVAHMTGAIIEVLYANSLVYLLDDGKLADVFRVEGLCFGSHEAIVNAISADLMSLDLARQRVGMLCKWFNDDSAQAERIQEVLVGEVGKYASSI